jgi:beta-glucosidase
MGLSCNGNIAPIEEIGFQGYCLADGPVSGMQPSITIFHLMHVLGAKLTFHTVRIADLVTVFPAGLTAAATWDRDLIYQRARGIGSEFRGKGASVHLGYVTPIHPTNQQ